MRVLQHDAGGGRETTVSFGVALVLYNAQINNKNIHMVITSRSTTNSYQYKHVFDFLGGEKYDKWLDSDVRTIASIP